MWRQNLNQSTMCCSGSTMALWYFGYSRKNTFSWQNTWKYFWGYFSFVLLGRKLENLFYFSFACTRNIIMGTLKIGQNDPEIPNLEFRNHGFHENQVFLPTEQAGTNMCWMIYQDINFRLDLSLFGWKENILPKQHIVQWQAYDTSILLRHLAEYQWNTVINWMDA